MLVLIWYELHSHYLFVFTGIKIIGFFMAYLILKSVQFCIEINARQPRTQGILLKSSDSKRVKFDSNRKENDKKNYDQSSIKDTQLKC